jgi:PKHD-type hydroxylase
MSDRLVTLLQQNPLFIGAALPLKVFPPLFNRYEGGQAFGTHVDNAIRQVRAPGIESAPIFRRRCSSPIRRLRRR